MIVLSKDFPLFRGIDQILTTDDAPSAADLALEDHLGQSPHHDR